VLVAWAYWFFQGRDARTATAYAARIVCSCRHVAGREFDQCRKDLPSGMDFVLLSEDEEEKAVSAWLPFFASDTARYRKGPGCQLERWEA
jgi:hypothetical protein